MKLSSALLLVAAASVVCAEDTAPFKFPETNYDFVAHDIGNMPGTDVDDCFTKCTTIYKDQGCKAVSYHQGVCYFKNARDQIIVKTGVNSTGVYAEKQDPCSVILPNTDYVGNDIANKPGKVTDCCSICTDYPGCRAYSWNNNNGGTCWLKSSRGMVIQSQDVQSGLAYPLTETHDNQEVEYNIDYTDHDIGNKPSATAQGCFDICRKFTGCYAFSWNNMNGGTCWLKAQKSQPITKSGVISAVVNPSYPTCDKIGDGTDIVGHDLASRSAVPNPNDCCGFCVATTGCTSFSWSNYLGGTCWFKTQVITDDAASKTTPRVGVISFKAPVTVTL